METSPHAIAAAPEGAQAARPVALPADGSLPDMMTIGAVCAFWGGDEPLNPATVYRQVTAGQHPKPIKVGSLSRWLRSELLAERARRVAKRDSGQEAA